MYSHCLFCNGGLGRNEALEAFPVGRRLAYDAAKGRLWVVCGRCARWNLTPLEERWEAIEQAERLYRGTRLRASTDNVGMARVADGADLVRIGAPLRPEFAAWRFGREFARRRRRTLAGQLLRGSASVAALAALVVSGNPLGAWWLLDDVDGLKADEKEAARLRAPVTARVRVGDVLLRLAIDPAFARPRVAEDGALSLVVRFGREERALLGVDAARALGTVLAAMNRAGAEARAVDYAVGRVERAGGADGFLAEVSRMRLAPNGRPARAADDGAPRTGLLALSSFDRLALEMALHEERERRALHGEFAELERAWRDAEEIAAIADSLALPARVEQAFARLRGRRDA